MQTKSSSYLFSQLQITKPLPAMEESAISPDFAQLMVSLILEKKPELIFELGSGVSTLIAAYTLKKIGIGKVISLEHERKYLKQTINDIVKHGLEPFSSVIYAPLKKIKIKNKSWNWYNISTLKNLEFIDMLIVDGPPGDIQDCSRYPALPLLSKFLKVNSIILMDDTYRRDEKKILDLWLKEFDCFTVEYIDCERGAAILYKK